MAFLQQRSACFEKVFSRPAEFVVRAPGRINLIGEHVDYQEGLVLPAAIDRYVIASVAANRTEEIAIWSAATGQAPLRCRLDALSPRRDDFAWSNYVFGVVAQYRKAGLEPAGFDIAFESTIALGAGLSSSAALESGAALATEALAGVSLSPRERSILCLAAEHEFAGVPCGMMDQLAVNAGEEGKALLIDCRGHAITPFPLPAGLAVIVAESGVRHALADGEYAKRKADCETAARHLGIPSLRDASLAVLEEVRGKIGERVFRRARHVVREIERVRQFTVALSGGDQARIGELMAASHASLRDDYEVSCPELDALVEIALSHGVIGSRLMGGGFGGSTVNLVAKDTAEETAAKIRRSFHERHGKEITAFVVNAVDGAGFVD